MSTQNAGTEAPAEVPAEVTAEARDGVICGRG